MNRKQYLGGWLIVIVLITVVWLGAKSCQGQSYIGKPYHSVLQEMKSEHHSEIAGLKESVESDGSRNILVCFKNQQITSFAFDAAKYCVFYLVIMPDTSGHQAFAQHLDNVYERQSAGRWLEKRHSGTVVWKMLKSVDRRHTYVIVCPLYMEPQINNIVESYK